MIWHSINLVYVIFSCLYKTYEDLRHAFSYRTLYIKHVFMQYTKLSFVFSFYGEKFFLYFYLSVYIFIIYWLEFLHRTSAFYILLHLFHHLYHRMWTAFMNENKLIKMNFFCRRQRLKIGRILLKEKKELVISSE